MKKYIFTLIAFFSTLSAFCQQDSLLKTFKFRNSNYRAINLNIDGISQFERLELGSGTHKNSSSLGSFGAGYYTSKSTDKILLTATANLGGNYYTSKSADANNVTKNKSYSIQPQINILNKWFKKERFVELGTSISASTAGNRGTSANQVYTKNQSNFFSVTLNTGIGVGRLENITDMQNALWLNKELQDANCLTHDLSSTELKELGRMITIANNTRILDDRKRIKFILATVDNYFQRKGLIAKNDIAYFSSLNDILFFAFNTPRLSGTEKFIRLSPHTTTYFTDAMLNNTTDKNKEQLNDKGVLLSTTGFNKYAPHNLMHQNNFGASVNAYYVSIDRSLKSFTSGNLTSQTSSTQDIRQTYLKLFYEHAIYPNTRTIVSLNLQSQVGYQDVPQQNKFFESVHAFATANYFISYRTRFTCGVEAYYTNNVIETSQYLSVFPNTIQLSVNASVTVNT